jgi:Holliday junction resolvase
MGSVVPLENAVVLRIQRLLVSRGAWFVKSTGVRKVGCPDLLCCYKGRFVAIEVKRQDPRTASYGVTKKQELELQKINDAGGYALVAWTVEQVAAVLDEIA